MKQLLLDNVAATRPKPAMAPDEVAELVLTFFAGISTEQNLNAARTTITRRIDNFMQMLRQS
jgi:TetR/AcrR family transcriptional regulator, copper-responsive repressor